jgi:glycine C-acetyltransferase/8-amino-7-oxononanoate synthase
LQSNARALRRALALEGFPVEEEGLHIVPLVVGEERAATRLCQEAIERGVFAQAIRPPTVPSGTSRLRLAAMASHTASELQMAARVLGEAANAIGLDAAEIGPPLVERVRPATVVVPDTEAFVHERDPFIPDLESDVDTDLPDPELEAGRERLAAAARSRASGPFDIERETTVPRAA